MSAALEELRRLVPPPEDPPLAADWAAARDNFGFDLPQDYRELIDLYGAGLFNEELWVFAPGHPSESWDLLRWTDNEMWGLRYVREHGERLPYEPAPVSGGLIPWGRTGYGDICYWNIIDVEEPAGWPVVHWEGPMHEWHLFDCTATEFLAGLFSGRIEAPSYGDWWRSAAPVFWRPEPCP